MPAPKKLSTSAMKSGASCVLTVSALFLKEFVLVSVDFPYQALHPRKVIRESRLASSLSDARPERDGELPKLKACASCFQGAGSEESSGQSWA